jgi:hypothetical protein
MTLFQWLSVSLVIIAANQVCLKLRTDISRSSEFNVYDFATLKRGQLVPLEVDATLKEGGFVCVKMDVDGANSTYFPIARYADYESRTNEEVPLRPSYFFF